ncbi:efflux RND transporter periplasmic adaptor subunit [Jiangella aurantiaca]|uniref:Efflux RND transporter periplasmic adaptor subunit n=1 Tax=Jiangella aurantiaca TaxID=2530373 RepID=A0A4R5AJ37_9ACTN|nr:peptidoglycan-binding protein [Jiangella aurantiaca]TDD72653.1 efflux RND transporter periplasmic adaptor subunit [Jiangella aurantiaca]
MSQDVMSRPEDVELDVDDRPRRRRLLWLAMALVVAGGAGASYWFAVRNDSSAPADASTSPAATADVTRETLTRAESLTGTLGYGTPLAVKAKGDGTVTGLAAQESAVSRGTELYRLDEQPVIAVIGSVPMYRELSPGTEGADVEMLEQNLAELGYDGFDVDDEYTWNTAQAVREWQDDIGAEKTGTVGPADVVVVPQAGRVDGIKVALGDTVTPDTEVLGITAADQIVSLEVDVADRGLVDVGTGVSVRLPGGQEAAGTVTSSTVVEDTSGEGDGGGGGGDDEDPGADDTITEVEVTLTDPVDEALIGAPVDVVVNVETREDVLVVPVNALLALAGGGFGLEVVRADGTTDIVPVETGMFANGKVEVSGADIAEGTVVGAAGR